MKKITWSVLASLFVGVPQLWASDLPIFLPIGNYCTEWMVTNKPVSITINLSSQKEDGKLVQTISPTVKIGFNSLAELNSYISGKVMKHLSNLYMNGLSDGNIRVRVQTSLGSVDTTVPANSPEVTAAARMQSLTAQQVVVPIKGLTNATVKLGDDSWKPLTIVGTNSLLLNETATNGRVRVTVWLSNGQIATYTQNGNLIESPRLSGLWIDPVPPDWWSPDYDENAMYGWYAKFGQYWQYGYLIPGSHHLLIHKTVGSDTAIERSTDLKMWQTFGGTAWDDPNDTMVMPINTESDIPGESFRARSY